MNSPSFHKRTGTTIVYITHDQAEAMALADRIAVMDGGRLAQLATPRELYHEPANEMVASFISQGILLPADVLSAEEAGHCKVRVLGTELVVRCRPGERPRTGAKSAAGQRISMCRPMDPASTAWSRG